MHKHKILDRDNVGKERVILKCIDCNASAVRAVPEKEKELTAFVKKHSTCRCGSHEIVMLS